ncbi:dGTP triphosphohydrolase [Acinetobacter sp. ANC 5054]|uniref:NUDIX domain-containing protein n=1 Tax=Acinetobacter sp. ANC 5054 TaxID=1977877 RepID=UPI000A357A3A|nr:thiamine phosphate synthase [Acinetobacter sp. ANC 5054]OTG82101.1 dGTP triphosphohydrolase [Acinetobacter sp. ANC 5054]
MSKPQLDVAIAILLHQDKVLVGWREANQHQGNKHEFPGGKVEAGETPEQACRREIFEEVGIGLHVWNRFDVIQHEYDDLIVRLHLFHAVVPTALLNEIQKPWAWYTRSQLLDLNFPKANKTIIQRLNWVEQIRITDELPTLENLQSELLYYWRVDATDENAQAINQLPTVILQQLIINIDVWRLLIPEVQLHISAIHLKQSQLMQSQADNLILGRRYIAACHDLVSAQHAQKIGCDAILLSPVLPTTTHPNEIGLGWEKFEQIARAIEIPVFALGGMQKELFTVAKQHAAYGIAGIRHI